MDIENRLRRLETDAKVWRLITGILTSLLIVNLACTSGSNIGTNTVVNGAPPTAAHATPVAQEVRTTALEIVNEDGETVAAFRGSARGAMLTLGTPSFQRNIVMQTMMGGPTVFLTDRSSGTVSLSTLQIRMGAITDEGRKTLEAEDRPIRETDPDKLLAYSNRLSEASNGRPIVQIGRSETGGGMVDVFNPFEKRVASVQSAKDNGGMIAVNKLNGELSKALSAD